MKAVILASALPKDNNRSTEPAGLRTLIDRPFLQHVLERLVDLGAREFEIIAGDAPERIRDILGNGSRWGARIRYHLVREATNVVPAIKRALIGHNANVVLARADRLWETERLTDETAPCVYCLSSDTAQTDPAKLEWAGLAVISSRALHGASDSLDLESFEQWLMDPGLSEARIRGARASVSCSTVSNWLAAQRAVLEGCISGLHFGGREGEPGIWLSRNVRLAPGVMIEAPAYIGEDCRIESGALLGPNTVVGAGSVVANDALLGDALVQPGSYVGESITVQGAVAGHGVVQHGGLDVATSIPDAHILDAVAPSKGATRIGPALTTLAASLMLLPMLPLAGIALLWLWATGQGQLTSREIVRLPADDKSSPEATVKLWDVTGNKRGLATTIVRITTKLLALAQRRLSLVGVTPRTPTNVEGLANPLRDTYLQGRAGLVTEASVTLGDEATDEERLVADVAYIVSRSTQRDLGILLQAVAP